MTKPVLILGVGNILLSDEGIGVHVARHLQSMEMPSDVEVLDGGTGGFELIEFFRGRKKVLLLDAVLADDPPGSVVAATPEELVPRWGIGFSSHDSGLCELISQTRGLYPSIEMLIFGIVPYDCQTAGTDLSPALQSLVPRLASMALAHATSTPRGESGTISENRAL